MVPTPLLSESIPLLQPSRGRTFNIKDRISYYVPITSWLPSYSPRKQLKGDFLAGLTLACVIVPQSISYATSLAHLSPFAGLFSASIPALLYAIFGSSRHLNVAPEAALSLLIGQAIKSLATPGASEEKRLHEAVMITTIITFQEGVFAFLLGFFRLGFIDVVLSRALLRGFITAIALVIAVEQLIPMLGLEHLEASLPTPSGPPSTFERIYFMITNLSETHVPTAVVAFSSLAVLVAIRMLKSFIKSYCPSHNPEEVCSKPTARPPLPIRILRPILIPLPEILLLTLSTTLLSSILHLSSSPYDIPVLGKISIGENQGRMIDFPIKPWEGGSGGWKWVHKTTGTSVMIAIIGYIDSVIAAKQNSDRFGYSVSSNREWVALGIANMGGSFIPGLLPAYGSTARTRLSADTGATSQMSSLFTSTFVLLATFFLLPYLETLPQCVLNAVVFLVVLSLLDELPYDVRYYLKMRAFTDLALIALTFLLTIVYSIEAGVLVSFVISLLMIVRRSSKVSIGIMGRIQGTNKWAALIDDPEAAELPSWTGVLIVAIREKLNFANSAQLKERLRRLEVYGHNPHHPSDRPRRKQARTLGLDLGDVTSIDAASTLNLLELLESYKARDVTLFLTRVHQHPKIELSLTRSGIIPNIIPLTNVFETLEEADYVMGLSTIGSQSPGEGELVSGQERGSVRSIPVRGYGLVRSGSFAGSVGSFSQRSIDSWG